MSHFSIDDNNERKKYHIISGVGKIAGRFEDKRRRRGNMERQSFIDTSRGKNC